MNGLGWSGRHGPTVEYGDRTVPVGRSVGWRLVEGVLRGIGIFLWGTALITILLIATSAANGGQVTGFGVDTPLGEIELGAVRIAVGSLVAAGALQYVSLKVPSATDGDGPLKPVPVLARLVLEVCVTVAVGAILWQLGVRVPVTTTTVVAAVLGAPLGLLYVVVVWPVLDALGRLMAEASIRSEFGKPFNSRGLAQLPVLVPYVVAVVYATDPTLAATAGGVLAVLGRRAYLDLVVPLRARADLGTVDPEAVSV